jgi:hypothetical protein
MRALAMGFVLLVVAVLGVSVSQHFRQRNAIDAPIYADLQRIEFEHRSGKLAGPLFLLGAGAAGDVIGVPSQDPRYPNAWLAVDKTLPDGAAYLVPRNAVLSAPCDSVQRLLSALTETRPVSPVVREFLSRHCVH